MPDMRRSKRTFSVHSRCSAGYMLPRNHSSIRANKTIHYEPSPHGQRSVAAGVNDMPGACQSRGVTEPQRDGGPPLAVDEVLTEVDNGEGE